MKLPWKKPQTAIAKAGPPAADFLPPDADFSPLSYGLGLDGIGGDFPGIPNQNAPTVETLLDLLSTEGSTARIPWPIYVSTDEALCVAAVYRCTTLIAGNAQQCPMKVYKETIGKGGKRGREAALPELERRLNRQPHPMFSGPSMIEFVTASMLLWGDGFCMVLRNRMGEVIGLKPFHPSRVTRYRYESDRVIYRLYDYVNTVGPEAGNTGKEYIRDMSEVVDWQGALHDGLSAMSVIRRAAASAIGLHKYVEYSSFESFSTGNLQKIILSRKEGGGKPDQGQLDEFQKRWESAYGGGIATRSMPIVLDGGWNPPFQLSINPADAQLLGTRKIAVKDILRAFGAPNVLAGDEEGVSAWGSGVAEISKNFLKHTVGPILNRFGHELTRKIFPPDDPHFIEFDTSQLLRGSPAERATYLRTALGGGSTPAWITQNEAREYDGYMRINDVRYDELPMPKGFNTPGEALDDAMDKKADAPVVESDDDKDDPQPPPDTDRDDNDDA